MLCPGKQKHSTTVYHVIWAELLEGTLTVSFVEKKKKKACTVYIRAQLQGSTEEEAIEWVEDLLNVAYKGASLDPSVRTEEIPNSVHARYQAEQEPKGVREPFLRQGDPSVGSELDCYF